MNLKIFCSSIIALLLLAGCHQRTRSISNSCFPEARSYIGSPSRELDEFDVLGLDRDKPVTEEEIQSVMKQTNPVRLSPGKTILLIQSGAVYPDGPMVAELSKSFRVVPFTGVAVEAKQQPAGDTLRTLGRDVYHTETVHGDGGEYSRRLRLAAARAGAATVVCYWGILESGDEMMATKTVSWIPVINWVVPDERQHMRMRLKVAVVDVASGNWSVFSAQPYEEKRLSTNPRREVKDQQLVESLKKKAYEGAVRDLITVYAAR